MKLRMQENSIRLRVARSELMRLADGEPLAETVRFGGGAELRYSMERAAQDAQVQVRFANCHLRVTLSYEAVDAWKSEREVGIYATLPLEDGTSLTVTIEKDFACLDRSEEDNADTFSNPHAANVC